MTEIPSHITSSAAQAGFQASQIAKEREARRAGNADAANRQVKAVDEQDTTVDTDDADTAVFTDSEGQGGQGRAFDEVPAPEPDAAVEADDDNGTDDGRPHIDLKA